MGPSCLQEAGGAWDGGCKSQTHGGGGGTLLWLKPLEVDAVTRDLGLDIFSSRICKCLSFFSWFVDCNQGPIIIHWLRLRCGKEELPSWRRGNESN